VRLLHLVGWIIWIELYGCICNVISTGYTSSGVSTNCVFSDMISGLYGSGRWAVQGNLTFRTGTRVTYQLVMLVSLYVHTLHNFQHLSEQNIFMKFVTKWIISPRCLLLVTWQPQKCTNTYRYVCIQYSNPNLSTTNKFSKNSIRIFFFCSTSS